MPRKFERADQSYAALDLFSERTAIMEDAVPHRMRDSSEEKANIFVFNEAPPSFLWRPSICVLESSVLQHSSDNT